MVLGGRLAFWSAIVAPVLMGTAAVLPIVVTAVASGEGTATSLLMFPVAWLVALLTAGSPALVIGAVLLAYRMAWGELTASRVVLVVWPLSIALATAVFWFGRMTDELDGAFVSGLLYGTLATVIALGLWAVRDRIGLSSLGRTDL
jgi:hypothetical protein